MKHLSGHIRSARSGNPASPLSPTTRAFVLLSLAAALCGLAGSEVLAAEAAKAEPPIVAKCRADLAKRLDVAAADIRMIESEATVWPDGALGMPEPGRMYTQALTPGFRILLQSGNRGYLYTATDKTFRFGGPVQSWARSTLYLNPVPNDANLNSDLYWCSSLGTNNRLLLSGVSDYWPQAGGIVIAKRRTSRSFHDLVYVKAGNPEKATKLRTAVDFGDAALNSTQDEWAAFCKPSMGVPWKVVIGSFTDSSAEMRTLDLPKGVMGGRIAWEEDTLFILAQKDEKATCYRISPKDAAPKWQAANPFEFPGMSDMLNKSESLVVSQEEEAGKPVVEVARVWFTGDRKVKARLSGLTLKGHEMQGCCYVFVWGLNEEGEAESFLVDIGSGEIVPGIKGAVQNIKAFLHPPHGSPVAADKA